MNMKELQIDAAGQEDYNQALKELDSVLGRLCKQEDRKARMLRKSILFNI